MIQTQLLQWYHEMGVDEAIEDTPVNQLEKIKKENAMSTFQAKRTASAGGVPLQNPENGKLQTRELVDGCKTREALEKVVRDFKGLAITKTATNTVFCDGNPEADIMMIGEAPGAEEDIQGIPFCGASGKMLEQALAYIGLERSRNFYITNTIFWRPPGNRKPTPEELAVCEPFLQKHIALVKPKLIILIGGTAVTGVLGQKQGITALRGKFFNYTNPYLDGNIDTTAIFHPSYLLRSPGQKRFFWQDLLKLRQHIEQHNIKL